MTAASLPVMAAPLAYDYVDLSYVVNTELESASGIDGDGYGIEASVGLGDYFYVAGEATGRDLDVSGTIFAYDTLSIGAGAHYTFADVYRKASLDLYGGLSYDRQSDDVVGVGKLDGYGAEAGVRVGIDNFLELFVSVDYSDLSAENTDLDTALLGYTVGGVFQFTEKLGVLASYFSGEYDDDLDTLELSEWRVGARFSF